MTVCIATDSYYPQPGGIATFYGHLSKLLIQQGHQCIVLTIGSDINNVQKQDEVLEENGLTKVVLHKTYYEQLAYYKKFFRPGGYEAYRWISIGVAMRKWLEQNATVYNIEIVEASDYGGFGLFLVDRSLPPLVISGHGSLLQYSKINFSGNDEQVLLIKKMEQLSFNCADGIIAHSYLNKEDLEKITSTPVAFATAPWINNGVVESLPKKNFIAVIGGLQVIKGGITMAKTVELLAKNDPHFKLYWVGPDFFVAPGSERMSLYLRNTFKHIWGKNFIWLDQLSRDEAKKMLLTAQLIVIPSDWETFNYVALEAAWQGKPIIITKNTGAEYIFEHETEALVIPARDENALASAIIHLLANPGFAQQLGRNAHEKIKRLFFPEKIVEERLGAYRLFIKHRKKHSNFQLRTSFLSRYISLHRKVYYRTRAILKRILLERK